MSGEGGVCVGEGGVGEVGVCGGWCLCWGGWCLCWGGGGGVCVGEGGVCVGEDFPNRQRTHEGGKLPNTGAVTS